MGYVVNDSNHKCGVNSNTLYDVNSNTLIKKDTFEFD